MKKILVLMLLMPIGLFAQMVEKDFVGTYEMKNVTVVLFMENGVMKYKDNYGGKENILPTQYADRNAIVKMKLDKEENIPEKMTGLTILNDKGEPQGLIFNLPVKKWGYEPGFYFRTAFSVRPLKKIK